ncbi:UNVERIFIED_CONTAM: Endoplasmic reticulum-Golgi intermediate compartment protein 3 [Sesamum angustifolium]|uniref:Endoplasmic reticulum-Golgi intermediate compartment protein 3 n=1 Tax=Sesamum angustifolium TaxID=2727405 RepID=A0AAW2LUZ9_9LAMI
MGNLKQALKSLDAFPRAEEHLLQKTKSGAIVSIVGLIIMATLFLHELTYYLSTYTVHQLRLNKEGQIVGTEYLSDLVEKEHAHGHGDNKDHHEESDHKIKLHTLDEGAENMIKNVKHALANGEGCRIFEGSSHVNVSHIIHDLSFGPKYPGIHNPLDDTVRILRGASGTFKYYIKIVPTEYKYISKEVLPTNQFSVTEYFSPINEFDRAWPAVYFLYDLSPITVTIREERRSFLHFITRLCAVLGGTFALTAAIPLWGLLGQVDTRCFQPTLQMYCVLEFVVLGCYDCCLGADAGDGTDGVAGVGGAYARVDLDLCHRLFAVVKTVDNDSPPS